MLVAIINDTHFGVRGDNQAMLNHQIKFFKDIFFPKLKELNIKYVIHLGDLVDRRKYVNYLTLNIMRKCFLSKLEKANIHLDLIAGNHDVYYKSTNALNALNELLNPYPNIKIYTQPAEVKLADEVVLYVPWINPENKQKTYAIFKKTKAQLLFGHLEIFGYEMNRGFISESGLKTNILSKFDMVFSGHFHQKSTKNNIHYLGAPYEMTWADYDCERGFHIFDTNTRELTPVLNPSKFFIKVFYDDSDTTYEKLMDVSGFDWNGCYIKVIVISKKNPFYFDTFIEQIEKMNPVDLQIVEPLTQAENSEIVSHAKDTQTILMDTIDTLDENINKQLLKKLMRELYNDAINIRTDS